MIIYIQEFIILMSQWP